MMISPELYYKEKIEGKGQKEIDEAIKSLKEQIKKLECNIKNKVEQTSKPDFKTQLHWNKECLKLIENKLKK